MVKIEGLGTFPSTIRLDGNLDILFRPDPAMLRELNDRTQFSARILNKSNIGKTAEELVEQWNMENHEILCRISESRERPTVTSLYKIPPLEQI